MRHPLPQYGVRRRRLLLAVLALAIAALVAWRLMRSEPVGEPEGSAVERAEGEEESAPPVLRGTPPVDTAPTVAAVGCVEGRVVDEEGRPVGGLAIRIDNQRERIACDEAGHFELRGLEPGPRRLAATDASGGEVGKAVEAEVVAGTPCLGVELVVPMPRLIGGVVVTPDGSPVPGLSLAFRPVAGHGFWRRGTLTDAAGRFETRVWQDGPFAAQSRGVPLNGDCVVGRTDARLVYDPASAEEVLIRIVGPDGMLVPGCTLKVMHGSRHSQSGSTYEVEGGLHRLRTDPLGPYVEIHVTRPCDASGALLALADRFLKEVDLEADELVIRLEASRTVRGIVTDEHGAPVPGIEVNGSYADRTVHVWPLASATSDDEGRFVLERLPNAPVAVRVRANQGSWGPTPERTLAEDEDEVRLVLRRGGVFRVRVRGPEGEPVIGAEIHVGWVAETWGRKRGSTDEEGIAAFEGVPPTVRLQVSVWTKKLARPLPSFSCEDLPWGTGEFVVDLPAPVEIRGVVVDESGRPLPKAKVYAHGLEAATAGPADSATANEPTGGFALRRLRRGRYRVWLQTHRHGVAPSLPVEVVAPATDVRLVQPRSAVVTGRLRVANPADWTVVWCQEPVGGSTKIEQDGRFRIVGIRDEVGALFLSGAFRLDGTRSTKSLLLENVSPSDGPFDLTPVEGGHVAGRIVNYDRASQTSTMVNLRRGPARIYVPVDEAGRFERLDVPPGTWTLELTVLGSLRARVEDVETGTTDVVIAYPDD